MSEERPSAEQGSLLISKLEFFYKGWFPRFGFFISRPYAVFYKMKVVFYKKKCTFYSFQLFLKPKQWFCQMRYCINQNTGIFWNKYLKCRHVLHFKAISDLMHLFQKGLAQRVFWQSPIDHHNNYWIHATLSDLSFL